MCLGRIRLHHPTLNPYFPPLRRLLVPFVALRYSRMPRFLRLHDRTTLRSRVPIGF